YYYAAPRNISVFDFSQVLFSALFGFLFFSEIPGRPSIIGYILIISMGVLLFFYNKRQQPE
ncbi:MAG: EamA family transporter, partial [Firmicutes bacterium]|nr:EamA family transporter [Bacillota bacterium]